MQPNELKTEKIKEEEYKKIIGIVKQYCKGTRFENWEIRIPSYYDKFEEREDTIYAEVDPEVLERILTIKIGINLKRTKEEFKESTLKHEIIHGLITILTKPYRETIKSLTTHIEELTEHQEELIVNEITNIE